MATTTAFPLSALLQSGATSGQIPIYNSGTGKWAPGSSASANSGLTQGRVVGIGASGVLVDSSLTGLEVRAPSLTVRNPNAANNADIKFQDVNGTTLMTVGSHTDATGKISSYSTLNITGYSSGSGNAVTIWGGSVPTRIVQFNTTGTVFDLTVSCPGTGVLSERFGASSVATAYGSTSIGYNASCDVSSENSVAIGSNTQINGACVTLVGSLSANYSGLATTGLGYRTSPVHEASICLGAWSASSATNQCTIGSTTYPINALRLVADESGSTLNLGVASGILTITTSGSAVRLPQGHRLHLSGQYGDSLYGVGSGPLTLEPYWGVRVLGTYPAGYDADNIPAFHIDTSSANDSADIFRITNNSTVRFKLTPSGSTTITGATGATFAFNDPSGYSLFKAYSEYGTGTIWESSSAFVRINLRCERVAFQDNSGNMMLQASTTGLAIGNFNPVNKLGVAGSVSIGSTYAGVAAPTNGLIVEGSIGIGTTTPGKVLEVLSTSEQVKLTYDATRYSLLYADSSGNLKLSASNGMIYSILNTFQQHDSVSFVNVLNPSGASYITGGNFGVGTTSPTRGKLHVKQSATTYTDGFALENVSTDSFLSVCGDGSKFIIEPTYQTTGSYQPLHIRTGGLDRIVVAMTGELRIAASIEPAADNTYYLGKNDDDSPKAWKGIILKDQTTGTYYRVQVDSGALAVVDLTD